MNYKSVMPIWIAFLLLVSVFIADLNSANAPDIHTWEMQEIVLQAEGEYENFYTDVTCWIELTGPEFAKRIYGFWDGANIFKVRFVATKPGKWYLRSGSNQPNDNGLNSLSGEFMAVEWTETEKLQNPNRRGFVRSTSNGHALQYADGTPFFMIGDTWLAGSTWRLPFRNADSPENYEPAPGIGFEDAVKYRKIQGFNSVSIISCFPNWDADCKPSTYADENGVFVRNAWEKFGYDVAEATGIDASGGLSYWGTLTAKEMRDEYGNLPFAMSQIHKGVSDFNRINPQYFQSLDRKMEFLLQEGFVPLLETVRRDVGPSWYAYFDFNETFARFVQYLIARYGAYNIIFSGIHLDWIPQEFSLTAEQFNEALTYHLEKYGPMPFEQPVTTLISSSTYSVFGHDQDCPWLTMHSVGNKPRDHRVADSLEIIFRLEPPYPAINFEPYYTGWDHEINMPNGERPPANSDRDNYFARAQMYGSVLSGGLSGHVHGTSAYDITTTGEPVGKRHHIWEALKFESANYMKYLSSFILSEGNKYQDLRLAREDIHPNKAPNSPPTGLDGWAYMMRTPDKNLAMLYFENQSVLPTLSGFKPNTMYHFKWFDPRNGEWKETQAIQTDKKGNIKVPPFPDGNNPSTRDWAAKICREEKNK
ncbi:MAG TPA: DUF4038 domain-containing protein [Candidatus Marinimicrobia bacterium]|nr:DUF4038 domain-containing protein [Candidatus Neomarinimicrobiota bacterium]